MSEKKREIREAFEQLMRQDESYDPAIEQTEIAIRDAEERLNNDKYRTQEDVFEELDALNENWVHYSTLVTMSGRVYLEEPAYEGLVPDSWKEARQDERGTWYDVEDETLESRGIVVTYENTDEEAKVRFGYGLTLPYMDDDDELPFVVFPGDVSARFLEPSFDAIKLKLHRDFPELMTKINKAIRPASKDVTRQLERLNKIASSIDLVSFDDEQRAWVIQYIYDRLNLDTEWQSIVRVQGEIGAEEDGDFEHLEFEEPYEFTGVIDDVIISDSSMNSGAEFHLAMRVPPSRRSDDGVVSRVMIPLSSLESIRSTRPNKTIIEQLRQKSIEKLSEVAVSQTVVMKVDDKLQAEASSEKQVTRYEKLALKQAAILDIFAMVKKANEEIFDNRDDAAAQAKYLHSQIDTVLRNEELYGMIVKVGGGVHAPNVGVTRPSEASFTFELNTELSIIQTDPTKPIEGIITKLYPAIEPVYDEDSDDDDDDDPVGYSPIVQLIIEDPRKPSAEFIPVMSDMVLNKIEVTQRYIADIDGTREVNLRDYTNMMSRIERLEEYKKDQPREAAVKLLHKLDKALNNTNDDPESLTELKKVDLLWSLADEIEHAKNPDNLASAIEGLFIDRPYIEVQGVSSSSTERVAQDRLVKGQIMGISLKHPLYEDPAPYLTIQTPDGTMHYVDMALIRQFRF